MSIIKIESFSDMIVKHSHLFGYELTPLKLQILLYYVHAWNMVYYDLDIYGEMPQAWINSPVYIKVVDKYEKLGSFDIIKIQMNQVEIEESIVQYINSIQWVDDEQVDLINYVLCSYSQYSDMALVNRIHNDTAWLNARIGLLPHEHCSNYMKYNDIKKFYSSFCNSSSRL